MFWGCYICLNKLILHCAFPVVSVGNNLFPFIVHCIFQAVHWNHEQENLTLLEKWTELMITCVKNILWGLLFRFSAASRDAWIVGWLLDTVSCLLSFCFILPLYSVDDWALPFFQFWFAIESGFSGQSLFEKWTLSLYNVAGWRLQSGLLSQCAQRLMSLSISVLPARPFKVQPIPLKVQISLSKFKLVLLKLKVRLNLSIVWVILLKFQLILSKVKLFYCHFVW